MSDLACLLAQYLTCEAREPCEASQAGVFTFDAGDGMLLCAARHEDGRLELFASPGYFTAGREPTLAAHREDDILERWHAHGVLWSIDLDPQTVLVTLAGVPLEPPWDVAGFKRTVETFREIYRVWEDRLQPAPDPWRVKPGSDAAAFTHAPFLRA